MFAVGTMAYKYTDDLLALNNTRPPEVCSRVPELEGVRSPLSERLRQWRRALSEHPDGAFANYVLEGIATTRL